MPIFGYFISSVHLIKELYFTVYSYVILFAEAKHSVVVNPLLTTLPDLSHDVNTKLVTFEGHAILGGDKGWNPGQAVHA